MKYEHCLFNASLNFFILFTLFIFLLNPLIVFAQVNGPGSTSTNFQKIGMGARAEGMGEAFTAVADDATATYWNPAGLVLAPGTEISLTHAQWLQGVTDEYLAFSSNLHRSGSMGGSVEFLNTSSAGALENPDGSYGGTGSSVNTTAYLASAAYAQRLGNWIPGDFFKRSMLGIKASAVIQDVSSLETSGVAFDVGYIFEAVHKTIYIGSVLSNFGTDIQAFSEPLRYNLAGSFYLHQLLMKQDQNILAVETAGYIDSGLGFKVGDEYKLGFDRSAVALRVGYRTGSSLDVSSLTAGAGIYQRFSDFSARLDYAFVPYGLLGDAHRVTLTIITDDAPIVPKANIQSPSSFVLGQEGITMKMTYTSEQPIQSWKISLMDPSGKVMKSFEGKGTPPDHYDWDGKDPNGELVLQGNYSVVIEATDEDDQLGKSDPHPITAQWVPKKVPYQYAYGVPGDLLFESGKADLLPKGYETIQKAAMTIHSKFPNSVIQIAGHTDNVRVDSKSKFKDNQSLSLARAKSVVDFLYHSGMNESQLSAIGYGDTKPIALNDTSENRAKNRRVELVVSGAVEVMATDLIPEGQRMMALKNYKEALSIFLKALESDSRNAVAYQLAGNCYLLLGSKDQAVQAYLKSLQYNPNNQALKDWMKTYAPNAVSTSTTIPSGGLPTLPSTP